MERIGARCEVYFVDPDAGSPRIDTTCPLDLRVGEKIRIAGKTCFRDSDDAERKEPVVCPDPLTDIEKRERGELPPPTLEASQGGTDRDAGPDTSALP
jgi:hypothetical protein